MLNWFDSSEDFKLPERYGDFRFVIWIAELVRILFVELRCQVFVRMQLKRQGFGDREDLIDHLSDKIAYE